MKLADRVFSSSPRRERGFPSGIYRLKLFNFLLGGCLEFNSNASRRFFPFSSHPQGRSG